MEILYKGNQMRKPLPCESCITLPICRSLMIKSFIEDYKTLCRRCSLMREYIEYESTWKNCQISNKFFQVQDYLYIGKLHE